MVARWKRPIGKLRNLKAFNNLVFKLTIRMHRRAVFFCGGDFPHPQKRASCPASRKTCGHRGKLGHFAQVCEMKSGASRNLPESQTPWQTTNSEGARYKS